MLYVDGKKQKINEKKAAKLLSSSLKTQYAIAA